MKKRHHSCHFSVATASGVISVERAWDGFCLESPKDVTGLASLPYFILMFYLCIMTIGSNFSHVKAQSKGVRLTTSKIANCAPNQDEVCRLGSCFNRLGALSSF